MKVHKKRKVSAKANGKMDKRAAIVMSHALWDQLSAVAEAEGREQGRPKSVNAVMRKMLQTAVDARGAK